MSDGQTPLRLSIHAYYKDNRRRDVDNPKAVMDAMKGVVFEDDSEVHDFRFRKYPKSYKDEVIINLYRMEVVHYERDC